MTTARLLVPPALMAASALAGQTIAQPPAPSPEPVRCHLSEADLAANARLTFQQFDQDGTTPATARKLGERNCFGEAVRATEHYLIHGPVLDPNQRIVVTWHLGQFLVLAGNEHEAARIIVTARRPADPERPAFDWNSYVIGTWAFLVRDRPLLEMSARTLRATGAPNALNADKLERLLRCFDQSYREAYLGAACAAPSGAGG